MSLLSLVLIGCDDSQPPASPPPLDLSAETETFRQCLQQACPEALTDVDALASCRQDTCADRAASWSLSPGPVRYSDGILSVEVAVEHAAAGNGPAEVAHEDEVWLGVTVLTDAGKDIDLAVQTVFPDRLDEPFVFSSEVGEGVRDIIFGLWGERVEPCDVARSGCQMFGFVLDQSLAAWPPLTYSESPPRRQRILSEPLTLQVINAGALPAEASQIAADAVAALQTEAGRFGAEVTLAPMTLAAVAASETTTRHANDHDGPVATILSPADAIVSHDESASADFILTVGGTAERLACMQASCADLSADCGCP